MNANLPVLGSLNDHRSPHFLATRCGGHLPAWQTSNQKLLATPIAQFHVQKRGPAATQFVALAVYPGPNMTATQADWMWSAREQVGRMRR
ncbi:MAG: hypothetical protein CMJ75_05415 [Planctomycetaceae bacterium]|nr:hypothetical protein [Planctomycetaceae bacterium]